MYGHTYSKGMDQPGKVANAARGHLISVLCVFFPFILDIKFVWVYQPESHRRRSHKISHPPSFYDACLHFSRGGFSRSFPSSTVKSKFVYDLIVPHMLGISDLFKSQLLGFELTFQRVRHRLCSHIMLGFTSLGMCVCVCFSSKLFRTSSSLDVPAGVTQEEGHTGFLAHPPSAVRALIFLARRIQPFLFLDDREVEFCAERA